MDAPVAAAANPSNANLSECYAEKRQPSSGLGDSSIESNPELDALSKMVVDKVLEKIRGQPNLMQHPMAMGYQDFAPKGQQQQAPKVVCDDKTGMAVTQMRHLLQRERNLVSELQVFE